MVILVQRRNYNPRPGGYGGIIWGGFDVLEKLDKAPEQPWEEYLLQQYGTGEFMVTKCGGNKRIDVLFKGVIGFQGISRKRVSN